ncbi:MAG: cell division protein FtsZ [Chloroflexi bacterium]|jgi:cell division protein FtsZ|nr:cell division protein FtsZ [Chloroflexota bacterium]
MGKADFATYTANIKVIGAGGGGCNAINRMIQKGIKGVEFIAVNTDVQDLDDSLAQKRIQIGPKITRGLGVGGDPQVGRKAADESRELLAAAIADTDMLFITCGMGGGTGTGASSVIAEIGKEAKALTIGIVTKPFSFEGSVRTEKAESGVIDLVEYVDTLITIPNDRLLGICDNRVTVDDAFLQADEILYNGVQSISELITIPGLINLDFADVKTIMSNAGQSWMAVGRGTGANRSTDAAKQALSSPLLDINIEGATGVLLNITGGTNLAISEVHDAAQIIKGAVAPDANIIFGVAHDPSMNDDVRLTLVATGFNGSPIKGTNQAEMIQMLTELKEAANEERLDTPAFLRYSPRPRNTQAIHFPSKVKVN